MFDGGRYDFVKLKYFMLPYGFGEKAILFVCHINELECYWKVMEKE